MNFRLVEKAWSKELKSSLSANTEALRVVCPFIKERALERLLDNNRPRKIEVITRFNLADFAAGVSDIAALRLLLTLGANVRGVRNLHSKLYLFDSYRAIVTSANLTEAALSSNHEFGFVSEDKSIVETCLAYFANLWKRSGADLTADRIESWYEIVTQYLALHARPGRPSGLKDEGIDAGILPDSPIGALPAVEVRQAFVKFLGEGHNREPLSCPTIEEIERSGCHWALAYPTSKRPTGVQDGALMFISRLTREPNDIRVFGRATGLRHVPGRDDATPDDIARRSWKQTWPRYIRVHHAEFVAGTMANGVSLTELMEQLGADCFKATQRNAAKGAGNTDPRRAYSQQAAVELSTQGLAWLNDRMETAFAEHGKLPANDLEKLDWQGMPDQLPPAVRILPMDAPLEFQGQSIREVQRQFFLGDLLHADRPPGKYQYREAGLKAESGTVVLFQYEGRIIASATLIDVERFATPEEGVYRGALYLDPGSIQIFDPVGPEAVAAIWPESKPFSHVKQKLAVEGLAEFERKLTGVERARVSPIPARFRSRTTRSRGRA